MVAFAAHAALMMGLAVVVQPAAQPEQPPSAPSWGALHPDLVGSVRPLLVDHPQLFLSPAKQHRLPSRIGRVLSVALAPDGQAGYLLSANDENFIVTRVNLEDGAATRLISMEIDLPARLKMVISPDSKSLFMVRPDFERVLHIDAQTGAVLHELAGQGRVGAFLVRANGEVLAASKGCIERLAAEPGERSEIKIQDWPGFAKPLAEDEAGSVLVLLAPLEESAPPALAWLDVSTGRLSRERKLEETTIPLAAADGSSIVLLTGRHAAEHAIMLDPATLQETSRQALDPAVTTIDLKVRPGRLFMLEYMVQPLLVRDLGTEQWSALIAPGIGGCECFEVSSDGDTVLAVTGPWNNGTLRPRWLSLYALPKKAEPGRGG